MLAAALRERVCQANLELAASGLVFGTFGNVSGADHEAGVLAIKPSGVAYDALTPAHIVVVSLETGAVLDGRLRPSSDTPTHLELCRAFKGGGVAHTHAEAATSFAQARMAIPCLGTTHADYFRGDVPVTRPMTGAEIAHEYERQTGLVILEAFARSGIDPREVPAVLVANHGPFTWGATPAAAVETARVLEFVARLAAATLRLDPAAAPPSLTLIDAHYLRKHGPTAYYGQN